MYNFIHNHRQYATLDQYLNTVITATFCQDLQSLPRKFLNNPMDNVTYSLDHNRLNLSNIVGYKWFSEICKANHQKHKHEFNVSLEQASRAILYEYTKNPSNFSVSLQGDRFVLKDEHVTIVFVIINRTFNLISVYASGHYDILTKDQIRKIHFRVKKIKNWTYLEEEDDVPMSDDRNVNML